MAEITQILTNDLSPKRGRRQAASPARVRSFITHRKTIDLSLSSDGQFGQVCKTPSLSSKRNFIRNILKLNRLCGSSKSYTPLNECFPPYGGSTEASVKGNFPMDMRSSETADLFMVLIMYRLKKDGRAAVIVPDGFLFGVDGAKLAIKTKMLREFNLHTIIRLPGSIFSPYTSIATNILFFNNEKAPGSSAQYNTKDTWFYRLDMPEG